PAGASRGSRLWATGMLLAAFAGCVGAVGDGSQSTPGGPGSGPGPGPGTGPGPGPTVPPPPVAAPGTCAAPVFSATLTREQYVNTVSDLLGFDVRSLVVFTDASDRKYNPAINKLSALEAEGFLNSARGIADQA